MNKFALLVECPDKKGLINTITGVLLNSSVNVLKNDEFVDIESGLFFMRSEFSCEKALNGLKSQLESVLPEGSKVELKSLDRPKKIIIFATKESHCLGDILIKHHSRDMDVDIACVLSNHSELKDLVDRFDIPFLHISVDGLKRTEHEQKVIEAISEYSDGLDYIVLAKYMRVLTPYFVEKYENKIINIHHSFLPAFVGANPYKQAYERGVKIIGATAHFVNNNLDEGPIISQDVIDVNHNFSWRDMQKAGREIEKSVLSNALSLALEDRIFVYGNKTITF
ncbi:MAG: formyltetrahydrofolate deformylase [Campylobacterales bacterium]